MITCQYCGTSYQEFRTTCSGCGASLTSKANAKTSAEAWLSIPDRIRKICSMYEDAKEFIPGETIPEKKLRTAKKTFKMFPEDKEIFLFCDSHPLNKGKRGFMICDDGLYWHNSWATDTNRNYLFWGDFAKREIKLKHFTLELGRGDAIGLAGLGSDDKREKALRLLTEIKNSLEE